MTKTLQSTSLRKLKKPAALCISIIFIVSIFALSATCANSGETSASTPARVFEHTVVDNTSYATCVCTGDIDRDGFSDVVVAKDGAGLSWYKYPNWKNYSIGVFDWGSEEIVCTDINGDGYLDIVGADNNNDVYWFENPGPNLFQTNAWVSHFIGHCIYYVWGGLRVADFNHDGKLDVVVRADPGWGDKGQISVFIQNASSWTNVKNIDVRRHDGLAVGDLDANGSPDVVLNGFWLENPYPDLSGNWTLHNIDGKWWNQSTGGWQDNNARVVVADLNGDGRLDVLFSQAEAPGFPVSWYESSDAKNGPWVEHIIGYVDCCHTLLVGDMNHDGHLDVVAAKFNRSDGAIPPPFPIKVFYNNGDSLSWNETLVSDLGIYKAVLGDIGNDGYLDIIGSHGYLEPPVDIWVNSPTPTPTSTPTPTIASTPTPTPTGTSLFSNGFENGFNDWTATSGGVHIVSSPVYSGSYAMRAEYWGSQATESIGSQSETYTSAEFYLDQNLAGQQTLIAYFDTNGNPTVSMGLSVQSGNVFIFVQTSLPSYSYRQYQLTGIIPGTWNKFALDASATSATIYLNDQQLTSLSQTNIPTTTSVGIGLFWASCSYTGNLYIDNVQISTPSPKPTWSRTYGGTKDDYGESVVQTSDGGYAIAGETQSFGVAGDFDFYLVKTDSTGSMQWNKTYGGTGDDAGNSVVQTSDGGYAIAGITSPIHFGVWDVYLVKTDVNGNLT
jgi:hypothetical protein